MDEQLWSKAHRNHDFLLNYYVDDSRRPVGRGTLEHYNTVIALLTYATRGRQLLKGDPGSGKTSLATLVSALFGGVPPNVASHLMVKGNPGITSEDITGRPHYGRLSAGEEHVVWHLRHCLPFLSVDELLRIPTKKQSYLLQGVEEGLWEVMDYTIDTGARPGYFTINPKDSGSFELTLALQERLSVATEHVPLTWKSLADKQEGNSRRAGLQDRTTSRALLDIANESTLGFQEKKGRVDALREQYRTATLEPLLGERPLDEAALAGIAADITAVPLSATARDFALWLECCMNVSERFGVKRIEDEEPLDDTTADMNFAVGWTRTPLMNRAQSDMETYAKGLAWWNGASEAGVEHLQAAAIATLNHRLVFTERFASLHREEQRSTDLQTHLTEVLVEATAKDFDERSERYLSILEKLARRKGGENIALTTKQREMLRTERHPIMVAARRAFGVRDEP